jgi:hypothetical protein
MKKISIILFSCIIVCNYVFAVPVDRTPRKVIQPNGDTICVFLKVMNMVRCTKMIIK